MLHHASLICHGLHSVGTLHCLPQPPRPVQTNGAGHCGCATHCAPRALLPLFICPEEPRAPAVHLGHKVRSVLGDAHMGHGLRSALDESGCAGPRVYAHSCDGIKEQPDHHVHLGHKVRSALDESGCAGPRVYAHSCDGIKEQPDHHRARCQVIA